MTFYGYGAGAWRTPAVLYGYAAGAWRVIQQGYAKVGGVWTQVYTAFTGYGTDYGPGTYDIAVPNGASRLQLHIHGAGGNGGFGYRDQPDGPDYWGGGGGSGGAVYHDIAISPSDWGQNIHLVVGAHAFNSTGQDTTITGLFGLAAGGGSIGGSSNGSFADGGTGGSASGGNVANYPGQAGSYGTQFTYGSGGPSADGTGIGYGGGAGQGFNFGDAGGDGFARFDWS